MFDYCGIAKTSFPIFEDVCTFVGHVLPAHQNLTFFLHPTCLPYVCWAVSGKHCQANILMWTHRTGANITKSTTRTQAFRSLSVCAYVCIRECVYCIYDACVAYAIAIHFTHPSADGTHHPSTKEVCERKRVGKRVTSPVFVVTVRARTHARTHSHIRHIYMHAHNAHAHISHSPGAFCLKHCIDPCGSSARHMPHRFQLNQSEASVARAPNHHNQFSLHRCHWRNAFEFCEK